MFLFYKLIAPVWKPKKESIERVECFIKNYNNMNNDFIKSINGKAGQSLKFLKITV